MFFVALSCRNHWWWRLLWYTRSLQVYVNFCSCPMCNHYHFTNLFAFSLKRKTPHCYTLEKHIYGFQYLIMKYWYCVCNKYMIISSKQYTETDCFSTSLSCIWASFICQQSRVRQNKSLIPLRIVFYISIDIAKISLVWILNAIIIVWWKSNIMTAQISTDANSTQNKTSSAFSITLVASLNL